MLPSGGIGLRSQHLDELLRTFVRPVFVEVHAENYLCPSPSLEKVLRLRHDFEFSVHAIGLSLGSADGVDEAHLDQSSDSSTDCSRHWSRSICLGAVSRVVTDLAGIATRRAG